MDVNEGSVLVATTMPLASVLVSSVLVVIGWQSKRCGDSHENKEEGGSPSCTLFGKDKRADLLFVPETERERESETSKSSIILLDPSSIPCTGNSW